MFKKNDYINYRTYGICKVEDIRPIKFKNVTNERDYYILKPVNLESETIFVPVDNPKLLSQMKAVLSPDEIDEIIMSVQNQNLLWEDDRKKRMEKFNSILSKRDEHDLLLLISCLYMKIKESEKGISSTDSQILKEAEKIIDQEFSFVLQISSHHIRDYIQQKLDIEDTKGF